MRRIAIGVSLFLVAGLALQAEGPPQAMGGQNRHLQGYAGPGWSFLFGPEAEAVSLGPVMFRISDTLYLGPLVAYSESASEGPGTFLGGAKIEAYLAKLTRGFYSTSAGLSVLAGAADLTGASHFAAQLTVELNANVLLFPSFCLGAGPLLSLGLEPQSAAVLPGFGFYLKEGMPDFGKPLFAWSAEVPRIGGYWQGLWTRVNGRFVFIDGGGTRVELPRGLAFGITGGVLRQKVEQSGSELAIMLTGLTAEWNWRPTRWLTVTPRVFSGLGMYGWTASDGSLSGGPHFVIRPELCAYLGVLPFLEVGGGIGYQLVAGQSTASVTLEPLSSPAFSVQARVGHR